MIINEFSIWKQWGETRWNIALINFMWFRSKKCKECYVENISSCELDVAGNAFYYFRDFSVAEKYEPTQRCAFRCVGLRGWIDDRSGSRVRGRPSRRGIDIHIQSLPAVSDICGDVYLKTGARSPAGTRSRGGSFSSRFFPRYPREETHRSPMKCRFLYRCPLKFSTAGWSAIALALSYEYQRHAPRSFRRDL